MRVKIEKLVYGGEGLTHQDGKALFAPFVLPGEQVDVEIFERTRKLDRGRVTRVLEPSPNRVEPRCPHFGVCGGCDYQHISYDDQLELKEQILRETLHRIGRIDWKGPIAIHRSPSWEYRNRAQWKVRSAAPSQIDNAPINAIGYFRARSTLLCPIETCLIISPALLATFDTLRGALASGALPPTLREIEAFADATDKNLLLNVTCVSLPRSAEPLLRLFNNILPATKSILLQDVAGERMSLFGPGFLRYEVLEKQFRVGHLSFFQVNRFLVDEMAATVRNLAAAGELAFDLYAGVGLFAAMLADNFSQVVAVEAHPAAARDLEHTISARGSGITVQNKSASAFLKNWNQNRRKSSPDVVVVDPPRAGLEDGVAEQLAVCKPSKIVYVSCDPSTLARDLAKLNSYQYTVTDIHLFDMFPQTYHIECVVLLERPR